MVNLMRSRLNMPVQNAFVQPVMFAGEGAVNAPLAELERAKGLENSWLFNYKPEDIYARTAPAGRPNLTGWFKGADGRWRFEVDDSKAALNPAAMQALAQGQEMSAADVVSHPAIFELYPGLKDVRVRAETRPGYYGAYNADNKTLSLALDRDPNEILGSALHELQHAIQRKEGFARGGNPSGAAVGVLSNLMVEDLDDFKLMNSLTYPALGRNPTEQEKAAFAAAEKRMDLRRQERARLRDLERSAGDREESEDVIYRRLRGEVEARNVQTRRGLTAEQRRKTFPLRSQDFATEDQFGASRTPEP